jgi:transcriptional regulator with XRE-family HTH domain
MNTRKVVPGLSARLKAARASALLSQATAGEKAGVHPVSIAKFETDKTVPTLDVLYRLASAYGVTVCSLLPDGEKLAGVTGEVPQPPPDPPPKPANDGKKGTRPGAGG